MKKLFFLSLLLPLVFMGCKKGAQDAEPETIKLSVVPNSINSPAFGADYSLSLTAPETWTASCAESWVKVNPTSGNAGTVEISVKISANRESAESTSKIIFKSGDKTLEVPVKRAAKDPARLRITTEKKIQTPKDGGDYAVQVESNIKWQISSNASWAKIQGDAVKRDNATVNISVEAASVPEETTALIIVSPFGEGAEAGKDTVVITRGGTNATSMSISQSEINAPSDGGSYTINVTSNAKWTATKSWDADWLAVNNGTGDGNGSFSIKVDPAASGNDASTVITVEEVRSDYYKPVQLNLLVTRKGKAAATLSVSPTSISSPAEGGEFAVSIKCNYPWTANVVGAKIFSVSTNHGDGDATMIVTVKPTTDTKEETGFITIQSSYGSEQARINIIRKGIEPAELTINPPATNYNASYDGNTYTISVISNYPWTVTSSDESVATVTPQSGSQYIPNVTPPSFVITVLPATNGSQSTAKITLKTTFGNATKTITIIRQGIPATQYVQKPFSVSNKKKVYFSQGNLQYNPSNGDWRFALQQYHRCAEEVNRNITPNVKTYFDWFPWGGTGYNQAYPYSAPKSWVQRPTSDITGTPYDWGVTCPISNGGNKSGLWRTLTADEWNYVLILRSNASQLLSFGTIKDGSKSVHGMILLPDDWEKPEGVKYAASAGSYDVNIYSQTEWAKMETAGAVFLPTRSDNIDYGMYWTGSGKSYWDGYAPIEYFLSCAKIESTVDPWQDPDIKPWYDPPTHHLSLDAINHVRLVQDVK